ncbi:MAG: hypothetical protein EOM36_08280, partial [Bacteroidia bacterium]|nr:hypothetical protein [Bacteroidia bacterium]
MIKLRYSFILIVLFCLSIPLNLAGQKRGVSLERAIQLALKNNIEYNAYKLKVEESKALIPTALTIDKATVSYSYDSNNMAENNHPLSIFG